MFISSHQPSRHQQRFFLSRGLISRPVALLTLVALVCGLLTSLASNAFPRVCHNRDMGVWSIGQAPTACDASPFGDVRRIDLLYKEFVFDRRNSTDNQTIFYTTGMYHLIKKMAEDFYHRYHPEATPKELAAWVRAILTVSAHESFISHYRVGSDGRPKLMMGDSQRSHGMMQINQVHHAKRGGKDTSFDLVGNIQAGLEIYHTAWQAVPQTRCYQNLVRSKNISEEKLLEARTRGAYSAYNGGPGAICRYANPRHRWAKNDKKFYSAWQKQEWLAYVDPSSPKTIQLNTHCILDGDDLCGGAVASSRGLLSENPSYYIHRALVFEDGHKCVSADGVQFDCTADLRSFACLRGFSDAVLTNQPVSIPGMHVQSHFKVKTYTNRGELCRETVKGFAAVGDLIQIMQKIRVRAEVDSTKVIGTVRPGQVFQVLDFVLPLDGSHQRYYRVRLKDGQEGYIYAGNDRDFSRWAHRVSTPNFKASIIVPRKGNLIQLRNRFGQNARLKATPSTRAENLGVLPYGVGLRVEDVVIKSDSNDIWLGVRWNGVLGYVYAGRTYPELTVQEWITVVNE